MRKDAAVLCLLILPAAALARDSGGPAACSALTLARAFKDTTITSARMIGADAAAKTPAYCEVSGVITPVPGSRITVVYRLPEAWNGKFVGLGGGGWAGNLTLDRSGPRHYSSAAGLALGYATGQTDGGHPGTDPWDTTWAANPQSVTDFSYRAVHLMTTVGKSVVARYYGHPQKRAYFQGCSTGGRQGLMEVQRFPDASLSAAQLAQLHEASLAACDAEDGLKDGIVTDPRVCNFDPAVLQCKDGAATPDCLTAAQVAAVRSVYAGLKTADGRVASYPLSRGGEAGWSRFTPVAPVPGAKAGTAEARNGEFAASYEAKNPDITPFIAHGGKLLLWHGFDDPGPSPIGTIEYYESVRQTTGAKTPSLEGNLRLYLLPGVYHCRGGPGADGFESLAALDRWVETGQAPDDLIASREDGKLSRPLCRYPTLPRYEGSGDPSNAGSFECR